MAKNNVTRAFTRKLTNLECFTCSDKGNLSLLIDLKSGQFEIKANTLNLVSFSHEIDIYLSLCESILENEVKLSKL